MKKVFIASLCRQGILGGGITADEEGITWRTGKVSVSAELRNFEMKYRDIGEVSRTRLWRIPTVSVVMKSGETWQFIVFGRGRFCELVESRLTRQ